jgi:hypothetical protein
MGRWGSKGKIKQSLQDRKKQGTQGLTGRQEGRSLVDQDLLKRLKEEKPGEKISWDCTMGNLWCMEGDGP